MSQAEIIIERFGGITALARARGDENPSTVQGWRDRGIIPARRQAELLSLAKEMGIELSPRDFFTDQEIEGGPRHPEPTLPDELQKAS